MPFLHQLECKLNPSWYYEIVPWHNYWVTTRETLQINRKSHADIENIVQSIHFLASKTHSPSLKVGVLVTPLARFFFSSCWEMTACSTCCRNMTYTSLERLLYILLNKVYYHSVVAHVLNVPTGCEAKNVLFLTLGLLFIEPAVAPGVKSFSVCWEGIKVCNLKYVYLCTLSGVFT